MDSSNQPIVAPSQPESSAVALSPDETNAVQEQSTAPQIEGSPAPQRRIVTSFGSDVVTSLQSLMGTIVIAVFVITFIVQAFQIPSESMENTLLVGDYLLVDKLCYGGRGLGDHILPYRKISRGDVIVFHYPVDPKQHFVKRVIGVPGDRLRMVNKTVYINGKPLSEPYVRFIEPPSNLFRDNFPRTDMPVIYGMEGKWWLEMRKLVEDGELIVPQGNYFVMGDNRDDSQDSRYWGFVPRENIIGRPLLIYWSVKSLDQDTPGGRAYRFAYALTHLFQNTRWRRTLRLVN
jgi:signal peptidase I